MLFNRWRQILFFGNRNRNRNPNPNPKPNPKHNPTPNLNPKPKPNRLTLNLMEYLKFDNFYDTHFKRVMLTQILGNLGTGCGLQKAHNARSIKIGQQKKLFLEILFVGSFLPHFTCFSVSPGCDPLRQSYIVFVTAGVLS